MIKVVILGGGGHAKCVIDSIRLGGEYAPHCVLDVKTRVGEKVLGVTITGSDSDLPAYHKRGLIFCFVALGSTGDPSRRIALWKLAAKAGFEFPNVIHPSAIVSVHATLGRGVYIGPGAIINAGADIGDGCIINSGAIVEHDCHVGQFAHIAPGAVLSAGVCVGGRAHLGSSCVVKQYMKIGEDSVIGAGSVVVKNVPMGVVCVGNPAKTIRRK